VIACCEPLPAGGPGHPRSETVRVLATLRRFLREGTPWRSLRAGAEQASGSTLRRFLARWAETGVLAKTHALLVAMLRGNPTLIVTAHPTLVIGSSCRLAVSTKRMVSNTEARFAFAVLTTERKAA
jgi:hypothetical protein